MKRRESLVLGHFRIPVVLSSEMSRRQDGEYTSDPRAIKLSPALPHPERLNALIHELCHAALGLDGLTGDGAGTCLSEEEEERICNCLGNRLSEALVRNGWLRREVAGDGRSG